MADPSTLQNALEAMVALNAAISSLRLYPSTNPTVASATDKAIGFLQTILESSGSVTFSQSRGVLTISGQTLAERLQEKPQVAGFSQLMAGFGIKSITFEQGLNGDELLAFLKLVSQKPHDIIEQGGLLKTMARSNLRHVLLAGQGHVDTDKDRPVASDPKAISKDLRDEDAVKFVMGDAGSSVDLESFREAARDPAWIAQVFGAAIAQVARLKGVVSSSEMSEKVIHMVDALGEAADARGNEQVLMRLARAMAKMDDATLSIVLTQSPGGPLAEGFFASLLDQLDDRQLKRLSVRLKRIEQGAGDSRRSPGAASSDRRSGRDRRSTRILDFLLAGGVDRRKKVDQRKGRQMHVRAGLNSILKGEEDTFLDREVMSSVPTAIEQLYGTGKDETARSIIDRLSQGLHHERAEVRAETSAALAHINHNCAANHRTEEMLRISHKLSDWIGFETKMAPFYEQVCSQLKSMAQALIRNHRFSESEKILKTFHLIHSGETKKGKVIRAVSGRVLKGTATDDILDLLRHESETNETDLAEYASSILAMIDSEKQASAPSKQTERVEDELAKTLNLVERHIEQQGTESAVKLLFDLVTKYAGQKDFAKAEALREKLLEVDSMALAEIVKCGEIIEEEKSKAIDQDHQGLFKRIYDVFNQEETNAFYYAMESDTRDAGQVIFRQGGLDSRLYLIDEGQIKSVFHREGEEFLIKESNPGDMVGDDSFFHSTVCTTSAVALSDVRLRSLEKESLEKWKQDSPALASKLGDYCLGLESIYDVLRTKNLDRRSADRVKVPVRMSLRPTGGSNAASEKAISGTLADICEGGLSLYVTMPRDRAEGLFMGPKLNMRFALPAGKDLRQISRDGTVVAVRLHPDTCSMSVKFDENLDEGIIRGIEIPQDHDDPLQETT